MKRSFWIAAMVFAAFLTEDGACAADRNRTLGLSFAYNEFSVAYRMPLKSGEHLRIAANLDMGGVISGKSLYPGISADAVYLFEFARTGFRNGESMVFMAGPGAAAGYVRDFEGVHGVMVSLAGCIGFEYLFAVPVSVTLSLEPCIGLHVSRDRFGYTVMSFYKAGMIYSLMPHLGLKYRF